MPIHYGRRHTAGVPLRYFFTGEIKRFPSIYKKMTHQIGFRRSCRQPSRFYQLSDRCAATESGAITIHINAAACHSQLINLFHAPRSIYQAALRNASCDKHARIVSHMTLYGRSYKAARAFLLFITLLFFFRFVTATHCSSIYSHMRDYYDALPSPLRCWLIFQRLIAR